MSGGRDEIDKPLLIGGCRGRLDWNSDNAWERCRSFCLVMLVTVMMRMVITDKVGKKRAHRGGGGERPTRYLLLFSKAPEASISLLYFDRV